MKTTTKVGLIALMTLGYCNYRYMASQAPEPPAPVSSTYDVQAEHDRLEAERDKYAELYQNALGNLEVDTDTRRGYLARVMQINAALEALREKGAKE